MTLRRSLSILLLALFLAPAAAIAQVRTDLGTPPLRVAGYVGYESGDWDGLALRVDGEVPIQRIAPTLMLSGVGSVGYSHLTASNAGFDTTVNRLDVIPAARLTLEATPQLSLYGDVGLGLYYASLSSDLPGFDDNDFSLKMRFGVGGFFAVSPTLDVGAEVALQPHFGDYDDTTFTAMAAVRFRI